ncbi:unnamed protein product [Clavelina lepadiformis]|uniref:VWFA domain-containing protein n=1 Tax=Clavelina lepadiformis TaxID=159417 RepID=A0ABP0FL69_CLALP
MFGNVFARYAANIEDETDQTYVDARDYIRSLFNTNCQLQASESQSKDIILVAIQSVGALSEAGVFAMNDLIACARNTNAPKSISLEAMRALSKMPIAPENHARTEVLEILVDSERPIEIRLASYLLIIEQEPSIDEVTTISEIAKEQAEQPRALKFYINEHLKSQVTLRGTSFCSLPQSTIDNVISVSRRNNWEFGVDLSRVNTENSVQEKKYEFQRQVFLPYFNKEVNCTVKTNLVYGRNMLIPMLANVSISTELLNSNWTLLELKLDLVGILSVLQPLFGENGILPDIGLKEFLQTPISQLFRPVTRNLPALSSDEQLRLAKIQDEASMAYSMFAMKNQMPLEMKVFDMPVDLNTLMRLSFLRDLNLFNLFKIVDVLEGWTFDGLHADQPLLAHSAYPTSAGPPCVHHIDAAYFFRTHFHTAAQIKKIIMTGKGEISLQSKPELQASLIWAHDIQLPNGVSCGSGKRVTVGHDSNLDVSFTATENNIKASVGTLPARTELISFKIEEVKSKNGAFVVTNDEDICHLICLYGDCRSGANLMYKDCIEPDVEFGLYLINNDVNYNYDVSLTWGAMQAVVNNNPDVRCRGIEVKINSKANPTAESVVTFNAAAKYIPSMNEIRWEMAYRDQQPWVIAANAHLYASQSDNEVQGVLVSANVTQPNGVVVSTNIIQINRKDHNERVMKGLLEMFGIHGIREQPHYSLKSDLQLPIIGQMSASGLIQKRQEQGYTARIQVKDGSSQNSQARPLFVFNITTNPLTEGSQQGYVANVHLGNLNINSFPYTNINSVFKIGNDSAGNSYQLVQVEAERGNHQPHFFSYCSDVVKSSSEMALFNFTSTVTTNTGQIQFDVFAPNISSLSITPRLVLPSTPIDPATRKYTSQEELRSAANNPTLSPAVYKVEVTAGKLKNDDTVISINYNFDTIASSKNTHYKAYMVTRPRQCMNCHFLNVETPLLNISSHMMYNQKHMGHEAYLDVHRDLLSFLSLSKYSRNFIETYAKEPSSDRIKLGYKAKIGSNKHDSYAEFGYTLGNKKLNGKIELESEVREDIRGTLNITCEKCLPFLQTSFHMNLGVDVNDPFLKILDQGHLRLEFSLNEKDGMDFSMVVQQAFDHRDFNASLSMRHSTTPNSYYTLFILPKDNFVLNTGVKIVKKPPTSFGSEVSNYNVSFYGGFEENPPLFEGIASEGEIDYHNFPDFCESGSSCRRITLNLNQITKCGNFSTFYDNNVDQSGFASINCTTINATYISSRSAVSIRAYYDGSRNPTSLIKNISLVIEDDVRENLKLNLVSDLSRQVSFIPAQMNVSYNVQVDPVYRRSAAFHSESINVDIRSAPEGGAHFNITTNDIPLLVKCFGQFNQRTSGAVTYNIPTCKLSHPTLLPGVPINVATSGSFESLHTNQLSVDITRANVLLFVMSYQSTASGKKFSASCGAATDTNVPCNIVLNVNSNTFTMNSRITSEMFQHTARITVDRSSGFWSLLRNPLEMTVDAKTETTLTIYKVPVKFSLTASYIDLRDWYFDTSFNVSNIIINRIVLNNVVLETLQVSGKNVHLPLMTSPLSWKLLYFTDESTVAGVDVLASLGGNSVEASFFMGENKEGKLLYLPSAQSRSYMRGVLFRLETCQKYSLFSSKNVFDDNGALIKMETGAQSNMWPFVNGMMNQWLRSWQQYTKCAECSEPAKVFASYDALDDNRVVVELGSPDKSEAKVKFSMRSLTDATLNASLTDSTLATVASLDAGLHRTENGGKLTAILNVAAFSVINVTLSRDRNTYEGLIYCNDENDQESPCKIRAFLNRSRLSATARIQTKLVNLTSNVTVHLPSENVFTNLNDMQMDINTTSSILYKSTPIEYGFMAKRTDSQPLKLDFSFNATESLINVIRVDNGRLVQLLFIGDDIKLSSLGAKSSSWNISFVSTNAGQLDMRAYASIAEKTTLSALWLRGRETTPISSFFATPEAHEVENIHFNFTTCQPLVTFVSEGIYSDGKTLKLRRYTFVNVWPFTDEVAWTRELKSLVSLPLLYCPLCLGELEIKENFDIEQRYFRPSFRVGNTFEMKADYVWVQEHGDRLTSTEGTTTFTFNLESADPLIFEFDEKWVDEGYQVVTYSFADWLRLSNPHSGDVKFYSKGLGNNDFILTYIYKSQSGQHSRNSIKFLSIWFSMQTSVETNGEETSVMLRYPDEKVAAIEIDISINGDRIEIRNFTLPTPIFTSHLEQVEIELLRNERQQCNGFNFHHFNLTVIILTHNPPIFLNVAGDLRAQVQSLSPASIFNGKYESHLTANGFAGKKRILSASWLRGKTQTRSALLQVVLNEDYHEIINFNLTTCGLDVNVTANNLISDGVLQSVKSNVLLDVHDASSRYCTSYFCSGKFEANVNFDDSMNDFSILTRLGEAFELFINQTDRLDATQSIEKYDSFSSISFNPNGKQASKIIVKEEYQLDAAPKNLHPILFGTPTANTVLYFAHVNVSIEGFGSNDFSILEKYQYQPNELQSNLFKVKSKWFSVNSDFQKRNDDTRVILRYPADENPILGFDITISNNQVEIRDLTINAPLTTFYADRIVAELLRNDMHKCIGFNVNDLHVTATFQTDSEPANVDIRGNARVEFAGPWNIAINDPNNDVFDLRITVTTGTKKTADSLLRVHLPFMKMDAIGKTEFSAIQRESDYNMTVAWMHSSSRKMVPVFKTNYADHVRVVDNRYVGEANLTMDVWNPMSPSMQWKPRASFSIQPTADNTARDMHLTFTPMDGSVIKTDITASNDCQMIEILPGTDWCVSNTGTMNSTVDMPFFKMSCNASGSSDNLMVADLKMTALLANPITSSMMPVWTLSEHINLDKMSVGETYVPVGSLNTTYGMTWPVEAPVKMDVIMAPNADRTARNFEIIFGVGSLPDIQLSIGSLTPAGKRSIAVNSLGREILSGFFKSSGSVSSIAIFPGISLNVPSMIEFSNVNADIPLTKILRLVPVLRPLIPAIRAMDIKLADSSMTIHIKKDDMSMGFTANIHLSGPRIPEGVDIDASLMYTADTITARATMSKWDSHVSFELVPDTMSLSFDVGMTCEYMISRMRLDMPTIFKPTEILFQLKTVGTLHEFVPVDIDWHYGRDLDAHTWNFNLRSFAFNFNPLLAGNFSIKFDHTLSDIFVHWNITSEEYPAINQMLDLELKKAPNSDEWTYNSALSNIFFWMKMTSTEEEGNFVMQSLTVGMSDDSWGIDVAYVPSGNDQDWGKIVASMDDTERVSFRCEMILSEPNILHTTCSKLQARTARVPPSEIVIGDMDVQLSWSNLITFARKAVSFNYSECLKVTWWDQVLESKFHMNDDQLRGRLSRYLCAEAERISDTFMKVVYTPMYLDHVVNYMEDTVLPAMVYVKQPAVRYLNVIKNAVSTMTNGVISIDVINEINSVAIQCNITCPGCDSWSLIQLETKLTIVELDDLVATITIATPFSSQYIKMATGLPIRPLETGFKSAKSQAEIIIDYGITQAGLMAFNTNITMPSGTQYTCQATRENAESTTMHCTCFKLENGELGPEVADFNIALPTLKSFAKAMYDIIKHLAPNDMKPYLRQTLRTDDSILIRDVNEVIQPFRRQMVEYFDSLWSSDPTYVVSKVISKLSTTELFSYTNGNSFEAWNVIENLHLAMLSEAGDESMKIPLMKLRLWMMDLNVYLDIGFEQRTVGLVAYLNSEKWSSIDEKMRLDLWFNDESIPVARVSIDDPLVWAWSKYNMRTRKFLKCSMGMKDSESSVNITSVPLPSGKTSLDVDFVDTTGLPYVCHVIKLKPGHMRVECFARGSGHPTPVCDFNLPSSAFDPMQVALQAFLLPPEIYLAAEHPALLKKELRRVFHFTNSEALNVISAYISRECKKCLDRFHNKYVNPYVNEMMGDAITLYDNELPVSVLEAIMAATEWKDVLNGRKTIVSSAKRMFNRISGELIEHLASEVASTSRRIIENFRQIEQVMKQLLPTNVNLKLPYRHTSIDNLVRAIYDSHYHFYQSSYIVQRLICEPQKLPEIWNYVYENYHMMDYLLSYFAMRGSTYDWFVTASKSHVITYNGRNFELPLDDATSECIYVHATDPRYNSINIMSKGHSIVLAFQTNLVEIRPNGRVYVTASNGDTNEFSFPYLSDDVECKKQRNEIRCSTLEYRLVLKYADNNRLLAAVTLRSADFATGVMGVYSYMSDFPTTMLPNGSLTTNNAELMNAYELTRRPECIKTDMIADVHSTTSAREMCSHAFSSQALIEASRLQPDLNASYHRSCELGISSSNMKETCHYTNAFVRRLRSWGYPITENNECLPCYSTPATDVINRVEVFVLVSLSESMRPFQPKKNLRKMVEKTMSKMSEESWTKANFGIVSYGGQGAYYEPMVDGLEPSDNFDALVNVMNNFEYDGPEYSPQTTVDALDFVTKFASRSPAGVAKVFVVMAPESQETNCATYDMKEVIDECNNEMASVVMWSFLSMAQCSAETMDIVLETHGTCVDANTATTRDVAEAVVENLVSKTGIQAQCSCHVINPYSGQVQSKCDVNSPQIISY